MAEPVELDREIIDHSADAMYDITIMGWNIFTTSKDSFFAVALVLLVFAIIIMIIGVFVFLAKHIKDNVTP